MNHFRLVMPAFDHDVNKPKLYITYKVVPPTGYKLTLLGGKFKYCIHQVWTCIQYYQYYVYCNQQGSHLTENLEK